MPTWNVTLTNIEAHPRTAETDPETPIRNGNRAADANRNPELHSKKIFLHSTYTHLLEQNIDTTIEQALVNLNPTHTK